MWEIEQVNNCAQNPREISFSMSTEVCKVLRFQHFHMESWDTVGEHGGNGWRTWLLPDPSTKCVWGSCNSLQENSSSEEVLKDQKSVPLLLCVCLNAETSVTLLLNHNLVHRKDFELQQLIIIISNSWIIQSCQLWASLGWDKTMDVFWFSLDWGQISGKLIFTVHTQAQVLWYVDTFNFIISWYHLVKKTLVKSVAKDLMITWYRYYLSPKSAYTSCSFLLHWFLSLFGKDKLHGQKLHFGGFHLSQKSLLSRLTLSPCSCPSKQ